MKYKLFSVFFVFTLLASSCTKFLEEQSQSEIIPKTATDFRELLMGSGYMGNDEPTDFLSRMDDDVDLNIEWGAGTGYSIVGTATVKTDYLYYTWQPQLADRNGLGDLISEDPASTAYFYFYERIMGCNAVLDNINTAIGSQQEKDRVKGEALAMRSFYYFRLVNLYGEPYNSNPQALAVPLKLNSSVTAEYMEQATVAKVYEQIVNDLKEAATLMDPLPIARRDYHINQPAIHILLSRVYLYMEKWEDCVAEANKVFEQGSVLMDMTGITTGYYLTYTNPEVEWMFGGKSQGGDQTAYTFSPELMSIYDAEKDVRRKYGISDSNGDAPLISKYTNIAGELVQCLRTGEAVLNRAEANVQLGKLSAAMKDLNDLRRTRIIGYTDENIGDKAVLLKAVRDERRKEFFLEGFRWFDLRRYGMPAITHRYQHELGEAILHYTLKEKDPMYTLPFPNSLLQRNPALKQNPSGTMSDRIGQ
ncbi:RagB/SusD family nutrient uptake outer membrane protein [Chitinophaga sp. CC14]|uniref:RagB/SusD family nutrient uptake outer membrane protein n=1 Tax=Chitinophaga TaxID=79328 RepID=UPI0034356DC1